MLQVKTRTTTSKAKQTKNIRELRKFVEQENSPARTTRSRLSLLTRVKTLGFKVPEDDLDEIVPAKQEFLSFNEYSSSGAPVQDMIAALRSSERTIRSGIEPLRLPRGPVSACEQHAQRRARFSTRAVKAQHEKGVDPSARPKPDPWEVWAPEELEHLIRTHLDCRIRVSDIALDAVQPRRSQRDNTAVPRLPYDGPMLSHWKDGLLPNLAPHVIVIREIAVQQLPSALSLAAIPAPLRPTVGPIVCSSRIPPNFSMKEMVQDYVSLRIFRPGERKLALTYETYSAGKLDKAQTRIIVTHGNRCTLREVVRDKAWHDMRFGRIGAIPEIEVQTEPRRSSLPASGCNKQKKMNEKRRPAGLPLRPVHGTLLRKGVIAAPVISVSKKAA